MLSVKNLTVTVGERCVVTNASCSLPLGSVTALIGKNGSGKSSFLNALAGHPAYTITAGTLTYAGHNLLELPVHERVQSGLFLVAQQPVIIPGLKVRRFLHEIGAILCRLERTEVLEQRMSDILEAVGLSVAFLDRELGVGFSGGERKRFEVAQVLLFKPRLVLLDEIDSGLDAQAIEKLGNLLAQFQRSTQATMLCVSHHQRLFEYLPVTHTLTMHNGQLE